MIIYIYDLLKQMFLLYFLFPFLGWVRLVFMAYAFEVVCACMCMCM